MVKSPAVFRTLSFVAALAGASAVALAAAAQDAPIVQPGAPGKAARTLSAEEATKIADTRFSPDDVRFMQDMIPHHQQAVEMAALVKDRTNREEIVDLAGRIDASQADEIAFMRDWLEERGQTAPDPKKKSGRHDTHMSHEMMGMASPAQMKALAAAEGTDFDKLFLELMIPHHEGAVTMAEQLLEKPGSAYDPVLFEFVNDVINDQTSEIERMNALLASLSPDARANLKPGFRDAGESIMNMTLVASLPKPAGFFDAENPAGLPPRKPSKTQSEASADAEDAEAAEAVVGDGETAAEVAAAEQAGSPDEARAEAEAREEGQSNEGTEWGERSPLLSFANTDMAFAGDTLIAGNYHGFNVYKLDDEGMPKLYSSVVCPGGQGDVSIVGDILIMSVEQTRARVDCGLEGVSEDVSEERFRGLRIFDISDLRRPRQVGLVQTCRGSHTHSVVDEGEETGTIIVYNSGTAGVRDEEELEGCVGAVPGDNRTALFRIDVVEIPISDPSKARIVDSPAVFADPETDRLAGLWQGGDHGEDTQETNVTDHCHDITVFPSKNIAAGACSGNGIIFDISNPRAPKRLDAVTDKGFAYWHSATFNNDGTKVLFTDEWGGGSRPRCRASDPKDWGANAIYDIKNGKLEFASYYKMPAPQMEQENCVAHNGSVVPVPGRDIFVQAWYQGGISVLDFTDSAAPIEIAYFDRGAINEENLILGGFWSVYFYDGKIYGTEITRGLDVLALEPSDHMTAHEIAAAALADQGEAFNPQQQFPVTWPAEPVVARAYLDQLSREGAMPQSMKSDIAAALDKAEAALEGGSTDAATAEKLRSFASAAQSAKAEGRNKDRYAQLSDTLRGVAGRLR